MVGAIYGGVELTIVIVLVVALFAVPLWAIGDVASRPKHDFAVDELSKTKWLVLLTLSTLLLIPIGLGVALNYLVSERWKIVARDSAIGRRENWHGFGAVTLMTVAVALIMFGVYEGSRSGSTDNPTVAINGTLHGSCVTNGETLGAETVSVVLRHTATKSLVDAVTIGGATNLSEFQFTVTRGVYTVTATSAHAKAQHWSLSFTAPDTPQPIVTPAPVALSVNVEAVCPS